MPTQRNKNPSRLPLVLAVVACLYGPQLLAQTAQTPSAEEQKKEEEVKKDTPQLEKVTVTGSLISRLGFDSVSPVQVITADTSTTVGQLDTAAILQSTNVAAGSTQFSNQFSGFVIEGGTGVQTLGLRGLGASRTLVLLDGRRPGPSGTRGQVGAFDLNVIPTIILQRAEILKDGGGSIYGSDAIAGVVNLITRKNVDRTELTVDSNLPFEDGGERFNVSGATGWNFDNGSIVAAFQHYEMKPLKVGDRDFFRCNDDLVTDANGNLLPFEDRSTTQGTANEGCINFGIFNAVDDLSLPASNRRYGPSPDGVFQGPIAGYRLVRNFNANPTTGTPAYYEQPAYFDAQNEADIFSAQKRLSFFSAADFSFDSVDWSGQFLYTNRETSSRRFRQFFPVVDGRAWGFAGLIRPIIPYISNSDVDIDYYYLSSSFKGGFGSESSWGWNFDTTFSRSEGDYTSHAIDRDLTGDLATSPDRNGGGAPINYVTPGVLSGADMQSLIDAVGVVHTGNTVYDQFVASAVASGELFELPAGAAAGAFGTEFRRISINDTPSDIERGGGLWGQSSAVNTVGKDYIYEAFGEIEVPLLAGLPGVEQLTFNSSARVFKYDTVADSDYVWKVGLGWQVIPSLRLRATRGTSYRAPGLYELFLGNLTGFLSQTQIDPCINWGTDVSDPTVRANCQAAGIPANYDATGTSSATITTGGGAGLLNPETSRAFTAGVVFTPEFANISASLDYFQIQVNDQIDRFGAAAIVGSCYALPVFPNNFCNYFQRNPGTGVNPYMITGVTDSYVNINKQLNRGYDLNVRWDSEFSFGKLEVESQFTYTMEDVVLLFDTAEESGYAFDDQNGIVTRPKLVGNVRTALNRGDWTYTWSMNYIDETQNWYLDPVVTFRGTPGAIRDITAESRLYHALSVRYDTDDWSALVGVNNVFDKDPPTMSNGGGSTRYGTVPAFATQYDWYGRSLFLRLNYRF